MGLCIYNGEFMYYNLRTVVKKYKGDDWLTTRPVGDYVFQDAIPSE